MGAHYRDEPVIQTDHPDYNKTDPKYLTLIYSD